MTLPHELRPALAWLVLDGAGTACAVYLVHQTAECAARNMGAYFTTTDPPYRVVPLVERSPDAWPTVRVSREPPNASVAYAAISERPEPPTFGGIWSTADANHLAELAGCNDPAWIGEVADRARRLIAVLIKRGDEAFRAHAASFGALQAISMLTDLNGEVDDYEDVVKAVERAIAADADRQRIDAIQKHGWIHIVPLSKYANRSFVWDAHTSQQSARQALDEAFGRRAARSPEGGPNPTDPLSERPHVYGKQKCWCGEGGPDSPAVSVPEETPRGPSNRASECNVRCQYAEDVAMSGEWCGSRCMYLGAAPAVLPTADAPPDVWITFDQHRINLSDAYRARGYKILPPVLTLSGAMLAALVAGFDPRYQIFLDVPGGKDYAVSQLEAIGVTNGMHFYSLPPATYHRSTP